MSEKHLEAVESEFQSGPDCRHCKAKISPPEAMEEHETMCLENDSLRAELAREREKWLEASDAAGKAMLRAESAERTVKAMGEALESAKMSIQLATVKLDFHQNMTDEQKIGEAAKILFSALHALASLAPSQSAEKPDWIALSRHLEIVKGLRAIVDAADALVKSIDSDEDGEGRYDVSVLARLKKLLPPRPGADAAQAQEKP